MHTRHSAKTADQGLTLLEVTFAVVILSAVSLSMAQLVVPIAGQSRLNRERSLANLGAKRVLERIQATPFDDMLGAFPDGSTLEVPTLPEGKITVTYADTNADPLEIRVDLTWNSQDAGSMEREYYTAKTE
jgi:Tfp pilus assembly protein PilV